MTPRLRVRLEKVWKAHVCTPRKNGQRTPAGGEVKVHQAPTPVRQATENNHGALWCQTPRVSPRTPDPRVSPLIPTLTGCAMLDETPNLPLPQFPHHERVEIMGLLLKIK